jgi:hypothetical protein
MGWVAEWFKAPVLKTERGYIKPARPVSFCPDLLGFREPIKEFRPVGAPLDLAVEAFERIGRM